MILKIGAILFGVGEGITKVKLNENCSILRGSIYDKDILQFFDEIPLNMQEKYADAINHTDGTFFMIKAKFDINKNEYKENDTELKYLTIIDKQIRILRLYLGRYIYAKDFRYITNVTENYRICSNFPSPDLATEDVINSDVEINSICEIEKLPGADIPFKNNWMYNVFLVYEKSFSKDIEVSFITIMTALEMIFVDNNQAIKEKISKRIAVYLSNDCEERKNIYEKMKSLYKKGARLCMKGKMI